MSGMQYIQKIWYKLIYVIVCIIYLIKLHILNQELLSIHFETPFHLLVYNDSIALLYFAVALALWILGVLMIIQSWTELKEVEEIEDICISVCTIIICSILIIAIYFAIDNPILKTILISILLILGIVNQKS